MDNFEGTRNYTFMKKKVKPENLLDCQETMISYTQKWH